MSMGEMIGRIFVALDLETGNFKKGMAETEKSVKNLGESGKKLEANFAKTGGLIKNFGESLTKHITLPVTAAFGASAKAMIDYESAFAGVRKTVDASEAEFKKLSLGIREMANSMPIAVEEIAGVAEAAGQLGVKKEDILKFTETMVKLGTSTNLSAEQAAVSLAQFANIVQMPLENVDRLGASLVALGNNTETTESAIVDMSMRLAGVGAQVGLTEPQILALAASMSSLGIQSEMGGSAMSRIMNKLNNAVSNGGKSLEAFAKVALGAGKSGEDFAKMWKDKPAQALNAFIRGLERFKEQGGNVNLLLDELGIKGLYEVDVLNRMSGAGELLNKTLEIGNKAWAENAALNKEAQRYQTLASKIKVLWNNIKDLGIMLGEKLAPSIEKVVAFVKKLVEGLKGLKPETVETIAKIALFAAALGPVVTTVGKVIITFAKLKEAVNILSGGVTNFGSIFSSVFGLKGLVIVAGVAAVIYIITHFKQVIEMFKALGNAAKGVGKKIVNAFKGIPKALKTVGSNMMAGLWNGIKGAFNKVIGGIRNIANSIARTFRRVLKIKSPSKVFEDYGRFIDEGLAQGISKNKNKPKEAIKEVADLIRQSMEKNISKLEKIGDSIVSALRKRYETMRNLQTKALDKEVEAVRKASKEKIAIYDKEYNAKLKLIDEESYNRQQALQREIDQIDELAKQEDRAREEKEHGDRLNDLTQKIMTAENPEDKMKAQKEYDEAVREWERKKERERREERKESLRAEIDAIREGAEKKKEAAKEELENLKAKEEEEKKIKEEGLSEKKELLNRHFEELTSDENLRNEALKLLQSKNQEEILNLLKTYEPDWQNQGQSFADAFLNGLNSSKQSIEDAITEAFSLDETIKGQKEALEGLEKSIRETEEAAGALGGALGGAGGELEDFGDILTGLDENFDKVKQGCEEFTEGMTFGLEGMNDMMKETGEVTTETTKTMEEAVREYNHKYAGYLRDMLGSYKESMADFLEISSQPGEITQEMFVELNNGLLKYQEDYFKLFDLNKDKALTTLKESLEQSKTLSEDEKKVILEETKKAYEDKEKEVKGSIKRISDIVLNAYKEKRGLTKKEEEEILKIYKTLQDDKAKVQTETQKKMEVSASEHRKKEERAVKESADIIIKEAERERDDTIKAAEERYEEAVKAAENLKKEGGELAEKAADKMIKEAQRDRDDTIKAAKEKCEQVVDNAKKQKEDSLEHLKQEVEEGKTLWSGLKDFFTNNPITRLVETIFKGDTPKAGPLPFDPKNTKPKKPQKKPFRRHPMHALGTDYFQGGLTWVGERGAELVELPRGTRINSSGGSESRLSSLTREVKHTGEITIKGVSNSGELVAVKKLLLDEMRREARVYV